MASRVVASRVVADGRRARISIRPRDRERLNPDLTKAPSRTGRGSPCNRRRATKTIISSTSSRARRIAAKETLDRNHNFRAKAKGASTQLRDEVRPSRREGMPGLMIPNQSRLVTYVDSLR